MLINFPESFFTNNIKVKEVFYFSSNKIGTTEPHFFICIKKDNTEVLLFSCCTSKGSKRESFINKVGISLETLVYIKPGIDGNPFNVDTYVDCNNAFPFTIDEFKIMYKKGNIQYKGVISDDYYLQIIMGMLKSPLIEQDVKDSLPNPDFIG